MNSSSTGPRPAYLDTCVVSGLVKGELSPADAQGFLTIAEAVRRSDVTLWASTVVKREIDQIPDPFRQSHLDAYNALRIVRASATTNWIDDRPDSTSFGQPTVHPTFAVVTQLVPDRTDAEHLFQAKMSGADDFITTDRRTILSKASELRARLGINVHSPAQFGAQLLYRSTGKWGRSLTSACSCRRRLEQWKHRFVPWPAFVYAESMSAGAALRRS